MSIQEFLEKGIFGIRSDDTVIRYNQLRRLELKDKLSSADEGELRRLRHKMHLDEYGED